MTFKKRMQQDKPAVSFVGRCSTCIYKFKSSDGCEAFPAGIPDVILLGDFDHTKVHPDQENDIVYQAE